MTAPTPAPAPLPAGAYDALHALADRWEADARSHDAHWVKHWRDRGDQHLLGTGEGRVRQWWDCATALRNLANDLAKETT